MEVLSEIVDGSTRDGPMAILYKRPRAEGDWPTVVMFHDGPGVRNATHVFAAKLAGEGYAVAVPDLYHRHGRLIGFEPEERAADPTLVEYLWKLLASLSDEGIQADLDATLEALRIGSPERLGRSPRWWSSPRTSTAASISSSSRRSWCASPPGR